MQFELSIDEAGQLVEALEGRLEDLRETMKVIEPEFHTQLKAEIRSTRLLWAKFDEAITGTKWTEDDLKEEWA